MIYIDIMDAGLTATIVTGGVGIAALCVSRLNVWFIVPVVVILKVVSLDFLIML